VTPAPLVGTWQLGDDPGGRNFVVLDGESQHGFELEAGGFLPEVTVAYEKWGELNAGATNAVLVSHALTGDSHAVGPVGPGHPTSGWWNPIIGPGAPIDTNRYFVVCPNVLGGCQGTTGPSSSDAHGRILGSRFPVITVRDQVTVEAAFAEHLGIARWAGVVGGSMGGMRSLEWCVQYPERVARAVIVAVGASASAEQIALSSLQVRAIRADPKFAGGDYYETGERPVDGLSIARGIGYLSYRTASELDQRFGRLAQDSEDPLRGGKYAVESYIGYHGAKLADRFDANSYVVLSEAMNHHDVGRGRGGLAKALANIDAEVTVIGIASDRLYRIEQQHELATLVPGDRTLKVITSPAGHDGFLLETDQVGAVISSVLND
jgi:homoserine O-acetyltransferase